jgi:glycosyltransferase involved in cell wall biosynthesis
MKSALSISIIVTNYNYARYLGRAIDSALAQTHPHVEVIVVDDGSTDDSLEIIARYAGRVRCLAKPNGGQASAVNAGFARSTGEIILFLDADDALEPGAAAAIAAAWHPGAAKAQFPLVAVDATESPLGYSEPTQPCYPGREMELLRSHGEYPSPPCTGNAYGRTALVKLLPMPEGDWWPDGYLIPLAPFLGDIIYLPEPLGLYRIHGQNDHLKTELGARRRLLVTQVQREMVIKEWAAAAGSPIDHLLAIRVPEHCKSRLLSLRLDRASHPFADDSVAFLVWAGIAAAWRFPHITWEKRLSAMLFFPMLGFMPTRLLGRIRRWHHARKRIAKQLVAATGTTVQMNP